MTQRILQVVQRLAPGGIETMVLDLQRLVGPDLETHIVSLEGTVDQITSGWSRAWLIRERLHCLDKPPGIQPRIVWQLLRLIGKLRPVAVHTHHIGPLLYGGLAARLANVPTLIHTEHDAWHLSSDRRLRVQGTALRTLAPILVADAEVVADVLRTKLPFCNPRVIPNGIDIERFRPGDRSLARQRLKLPEGIRLIGAAGRLEPVKGHDLLIAAFAGLPTEIHLALAGDGSCREALTGQARDLGLDGRIHFLGHIDDVVSFYQAVDLFCLPSRAEGLPMSVLEAQACGTPVVATRVGGVHEALDPNICLLVPADDADALRDALQRAIERRTDYDPRRFVVARHDVNAMVRAYRSLIAA
jgi:glycosyltransferase involved in cell wall biosynthesis